MLRMAARILRDSKTLQQSERDLHGQCFCGGGLICVCHSPSTFTYKTTKVGGDLRYCYRLSIMLMIPISTHFKRTC